MGRRRISCQEEFRRQASNQLCEPRRILRTTPVSGILRGHVNDFKSWRRAEHKVRGVTIRHDLHALSKAYGYFIDHNWARENPVRGVDIPSDRDSVRIHVLSAEEEALYFERAARRSDALTTSEG